MPILVTRLNKWRYRRRISILQIRTETEAIQKAQDDIGWGDLLNGNMVLQWKEAQHQYYVYLSKWNTGLIWVRLLIHKLWEVAWDQWNLCNEVVHRRENIITIEELEIINSRIHRRIGWYGKWYRTTTYTCFVMVIWIDFFDGRYRGSNSGNDTWKLHGRQY
jgi:hypothetical protein